MKLYFYFGLYFLPWCFFSAFLNNLTLQPPGSPPTPANWIITSIGAVISMYSALWKSGILTKSKVETAKAFIIKWYNVLSNRKRTRK